MSVHSHSMAWLCDEEIRIAVTATPLYNDTLPDSTGCHLTIGTAEAPSTNVVLILRPDQLRALHGAIGQYLDTIPDEEARL